MHELSAKREELSKRAQYYLLETDFDKKRDVYWKYINLLHTAKNEASHIKTVTYYLVREISQDQDALQALTYITKDLPKKQPLSLQALALARIMQLEDNYFNCRKRSSYNRLPDEISEKIINLYYGLLAFEVSRQLNYDRWHEVCVGWSKSLFTNKHTFMAATILDGYFLHRFIYVHNFPEYYEPELWSHIVEFSLNSEYTVEALIMHTQEAKKENLLEELIKLYQQYS